MLNTFFRAFTFLLFVVSVTGCQKKVNNWPVDPSHDRLFKPLIFDIVEPAATSVELRYTKSVSATKYIFEFSKDSLEFKKIVKTVEILADTLTPYAVSPTPTKVQYHTIFDDLDGTTSYSVRMKSVDTVTGTESKYASLYFQTLAEQLFTHWTVSTDHIEISWPPKSEATYIEVYDSLTGKELKKINLTDAQKTSGSIDITSLNPGTNYTMTIYNKEVVRGVKVLKTLGISGGYIIHVNSADDITALVNNAVTQGKPNIILLFKKGLTYDIGTLVLPAGLSNISFTGENVAGSSTTLSANLNIREARITSKQFGNMIFENVALIGGTGDFLINMATDNVVMNGYEFNNCIISNYRSLVRIQNKKVSLNQIYIHNSIVRNSGDYGMINIGGTSVTVDTLNIYSNTLINMATQLMDVRSKIQSIQVNNNTIYNQTKALTQLIRLDKNNLPGEFQGFNNIIAGTNNGSELKAFSLTYEGSFGGSYRTSEMRIGQDFPNITIFNGNAADIFLNPENDNFILKEDSGFGGRGLAGDPRWY